MELSELKPKNIFEQILFGQVATNNNVVALAKNVEILNQRLDNIMSVFASNMEAEENIKPCLLNDLK